MQDLAIDVSKYKETKKMYYDYDILDEFKAKVIGIEQDFVILDQTMFYPEGGGQIGDTGWLNSVKVLDTKKIGNVILHKVENPGLLKKGEEVTGKVDWQRRLRITRHHTATHLITAAARKLFGKHIWQAGAKKEEDKAHIDLTHFQRFSNEDIEKIEKQVNEWVMQNHEIKAETLPRTIAEEKYGFTIYQGGAVPGKELRIISIDGIDAEACGGTHHMLKRTGEIGYIKIVKRENVKDGVERLTFKVGEAAINYVNERERTIREVCEIFKVPYSELLKTSERFFNEWKNANKRADVIEELFIKEIAKSKKLLIIDFEPRVFPDIEQTLFIISPTSLYILGPKAEIYWNKIKEQIPLKGGGKNKLFKALIENKEIRDKIISMLSTLS
jgi:alanyl-tRNA synthetase